MQVVLISFFEKRLHVVWFLYYSENLQATLFTYHKKRKEDDLKPHASLDTIQDERDGKQVLVPIFTPLYFLCTV